MENLRSGRFQFYPAVLFTRSKSRGRGGEPVDPGWKRDVLEESLWAIPFPV